MADEPNPGQSSPASPVASQQIVSLGDARFLLCQTTAGTLYDLRWRLLRQGLPRESAMFDGDSEPATRHFAAIAEPFDRGTVVCCASFMLNQWNSQPAWQLRGMATEPSLQGAGVGRELLRFAEQATRQGSSVKLLWCNARVPAVGFYQRQGWQVVSEEFLIPTAGPHVKMIKP